MNEKSLSNLYIILGISIMFIIICVGIIGNILNLFIFSRKQMLKISTFRFQFYLSITDLLVLSICATNALLEFGFNIDLKIKSDSVCRIHTFLSSLLRHLSSVLLMMVNVERLMVVLNSKSMSKLYGLSKRSKSKSKSSELLINDRIKIHRSYNINTSYFNLNRVDLTALITTFALVVINFHYLAFLNLNELN